MASAGTQGTGMAPGGTAVLGRGEEGVGTASAEDTPHQIWGTESQREQSVPVNT